MVTQLVSDRSKHPNRSSVLESYVPPTRPGFLRCNHLKSLFCFNGNSMTSSLRESNLVGMSWGSGNESFFRKFSLVMIRFGNHWILHNLSQSWASHGENVSPLNPRMTLLRQTFFFPAFRKEMSNIFVISYCALSRVIVILVLWFAQSLFLFSFLFYNIHWLTHPEINILAVYKSKPLWDDPIGINQWINHGSFTQSLHASCLYLLEKKYTINNVLASVRK